MEQELTLKMIDRQEWIEPIAHKVQHAVQDAFEAAGPAGTVVKNALHGTWLGHPLHAALTDVPIGAWTSAVVMDAMAEITGRDELSQGADAAVAIGLVGAVAAAAAGLTDWSSSGQTGRKLGFVHGMLNMAGAALFGASLAARTKGNRGTGRGLSTLGYMVVMGSGYLGGKLAYTEQIGADHTKGTQLPGEWTRVAAESELEEGRMRRVEWQGNRYLLAKSGGEVFAMAEVCSHLGGPLAEGDFDGCTVKCPWHGSRFSIRDGSVVEGPSVHPQPCLHVRVVDGQVEVRSADR